MRLFNLWITNYNKTKAHMWKEAQAARDIEERAIVVAQTNWSLQKENEALKNELASLRLRLAAMVEAGK